MYLSRGAPPSQGAALLLYLAAVLQRRLGLLEVRQDLLGVLRVEGEDALPVRLVPANNLGFFVLM